MSHYRVTSRNLHLYATSPTIVMSFNLAQGHHGINTHVDKLEHSLGFRKQPFHVCTLQICYTHKDLQESLLSVLPNGYCAMLFLWFLMKRHIMTVEFLCLLSHWLLETNIISVTTEIEMCNVSHSVNPLSSILHMFTIAWAFMASCPTRIVHITVNSSLKIVRLLVLLYSLCTWLFMRHAPSVNIDKAHNESLGNPTVNQ